MSLGDVGVVRPASGTAVVNVPVTLTPAATDTVTVDVATTNGSGVAGTDYVANATTLTFAPGDTSKNFPVTVDSGSGNVQFTINAGNARARRSHAPPPRCS